MPKTCSEAQISAPQIASERLGARSFDYLGAQGFGGNPDLARTSVLLISGASSCAECRSQPNEAWPRFRPHFADVPTPGAYFPDVPTPGVALALCDFGHMHRRADKLGATHRCTSPDMEYREVQANAQRHEPDRGSSFTRLPNRHSLATSHPSGHGQDSAQSRPNFGPNWQLWTRFWPIWTSVGQILAARHHCLPIYSATRSFSLRVGQRWPKSAKMWPASADLGASANLGRTWAKSWLPSNVSTIVQTWPSANSTRWSPSSWSPTASRS